MSRAAWRLAVLLALTATSAFYFASPGGSGLALVETGPTLARGATVNGAEVVPGQVIVRFKASSTAAERNQAVQGLAASVAETLSLPRTQLVEVPPGLSVDDAIAELERNPDVAYAEPNFIRHAAAIPNDPQFGLLWGMPKIGAPAAWDTTTGSSSVVVAVVDTGVAYNHPDLSPNMWTNPGETAGNGIDDDGNGRIDDIRGWDFISDDNSPLDGNGHGTHVAGTIGARGNNAIGVAGVNWQVSLMALRAGGPELSVRTSAVIDAFGYACAKNAKVVNGSFGGDDFSQAEFDAIAAPACANTLFVVSAGNGGDDGIGDNNDITPEYPCNFNTTRIVCVAASDQADARAVFSNYGATAVDLAAPGADITSSVPTFSTVLSDGFGDTPTAFSTRWGAQSAPGGHPLWGQQSISYVGSPSGSPSLSDSPAGNYSASTDSTIRALTGLDLTGKAACSLEYVMMLDTEFGFDFFLVEGSGSSGGPWTDVSQGGWSGTTGPSTWFLLQEDLGALDGLGTAFLRFRLTSDSSIESDGAVVEDIVLRCAGAPPAGGDYSSFNGTSMATPHVAGAAALVWARNPALTRTQVRAILLGTVSPVAAFANPGPSPVATGGRLNLAAAIASAFPPAAPTITAKPAALATVASASFTFSLVPFATIECRLDSAAFAPCATTTSQTYSGLSQGSHTFQVRASNPVGSNASSYTWTIDTVTPNTSITGSPAASTKAKTAKFKFKASEPGARFQCKLDKRAWTACASPKTYKKLKKGSHTFRVRAIDPAGHVDGTPAKKTWRIR